MSLKRRKVEAICTHVLQLYAYEEGPLRGLAQRQMTDKIQRMDEERVSKFYADFLQVMEWRVV